MMKTTSRERIGIIAIAAIALAVTGAGLYLSSRQPIEIATPDDIEVLLHADTTVRSGSGTDHGSAVPSLSDTLARHGASGTAKQKAKGKQKAKQKKQLKSSPLDRPI